jgi:hypothetical protein
MSFTVPLLFLFRLFPQFMLLLPALPLPPFAPLRLCARRLSDLAFLSSRHPLHCRPTGFLPVNYFTKRRDGTWQRKA